MEELKEKHSLIGDVRGMGLIQVMELVRDRRTKEPAAEETVAMLEAMREEGVLCGQGAPPLKISRIDADLFAERLDRAFSRVMVAA